MYQLLLKLMLLAALLQLGISVSEIQNCHTRACLKQFEKRARNILNVDWNPISLWPEEAKKFQPLHK